MSVTKRISGGAIALALLGGTAACVTDPVTGERRVDQRVIGGVVGTAGGYLLGDLLGGRRDRTEKIVGAGIGAIAGAAVGDYMERQRRELEARTAGTGVVVEQQGSELVLTATEGAGITFAVNSADIQPQFRATLDRIAQTMNAYPSTLIDVYGHTDTSGGDRINIPLSQSRAQAVANYLISRGVNPARIMARGFGSSQPVADNSTPMGRAQNRRVEIRIAPATRG